MSKPSSATRSTPAWGLSASIPCFTDGFVPASSQPPDFISSTNSSSRRAKERTLDLQIDLKKPSKDSFGSNQLSSGSSRSSQLAASSRRPFIAQGNGCAACTSRHLFSLRLFITKPAPLSLSLSSALSKRSLPSFCFPISRPPPLLSSLERPITADLPHWSPLPWSWARCPPLLAPWEAKVWGRAVRSIIARSSGTTSRAPEAGAWYQFREGRDEPQGLAIPGCHAQQLLAPSPPPAPRCLGSIPTLVCSQAAKDSLGPVSCLRPSLPEPDPCGSSLLPSSLSVGPVSSLLANVLAPSDDVGFILCSMEAQVRPPQLPILADSDSADSAPTPSATS